MLGPGKSGGVVLARSRIAQENEHGRRVTQRVAVKSYYSTKDRDGYWVQMADFRFQNDIPNRSEPV